ncbi:MAG: 50S ribosomal protein L23 [Clostridium sp.]|nr:MAG: 50S ribosomal protein L23 [Clostridium sp.]
MLIKSKLKKCCRDNFFKVKVMSVSTITVHPKHKRVGQHEGYTQAYKKAICKLAKDNKIEAFEI